MSTFLSLTQHYAVSLNAGAGCRMLVRHDGGRLEVRWDGSFELAGPCFTVRIDHPEIGRRGIAGYPVDELRDLLDDLRSADRRADAIFGRADAVTLTEEIVAQLVRTGWDEDRVRAAARQGAQYSPSRGKLLFPAMSGSF